MFRRTRDAGSVAEGPVVTPAQKAYFDAFGYVLLPRLFRDDIGAITESFDRVFEATPSQASTDTLDPDLVKEAFASTSRIDSYHHLHRGEHRAIIPNIVQNSPDLQWLLTDPRILGLAETLLGPGFEDRGSDGNILDCDTSWHCDVYDAPLEMFHIKVLFYLDPLDDDSGALRVMPGTHHYASKYAQQMRHDLDNWTAVESIFGVPDDAIPAQVVPTQPGDVVALNFRTMHATFHGAPGRRLFTMNYRAATA